MGQLLQSWCHCQNEMRTLIKAMTHYHCAVYLMKSSACSACPCLALLGLQLELGGLLGTGMALPCPPSVLCRREFTDQIMGITRVTALLLSKQSDSAHIRVCCPFLTPSLPRASPHRRGRAGMLLGLLNPVPYGTKNRLFQK